MTSLSSQSFQMSTTPVRETSEVSLPLASTKSVVSNSCVLTHAFCSHYSGFQSENFHTFPFLQKRICEKAWHLANSIWKGFSLRIAILQFPAVQFVEGFFFPLRYSWSLSLYFWEAALWDSWREEWRCFLPLSPCLVLMGIILFVLKKQAHGKQKEEMP